MSSVLMRFTVVCLCLMLAACGGRGGTQEPQMTAEQFQARQVEESRVAGLNEMLLQMAVEASGAEDISVYRIGPEDRLKIDVFNVPELSHEVRVDGTGRIPLPLIGDVAVSGLTLAQAEETIAERYADGYVRNPQVSIQVTDFRSQQFTVIGAVGNPTVYAVQRSTSLVEALAMAGGMSSDAGELIYLTDRMRDPETGEMGVRSYVVSVSDLMNSPAELNVTLGESAMINVPRSGSVFVEGSVGRPGVYAKQPDTTILKAIAMAGGMEFEASRSRIKVVRRTAPDQPPVERYYALAELREDPANDVVLRDGDVVVVESSGFRTTVISTARFVTPLALLGFRPL